MTYELNGRWVFLAENGKLRKYKTKAEAEAAEGLVIVDVPDEDWFDIEEEDSGSQS